MRIIFFFFFWDKHAFMWIGVEIHVSLICQDKTIQIHKFNPNLTYLRIVSILGKILYNCE